jgi:cytochrome oxidase Cu insertion factor (SCO1/SenC/PrrC family)
VRIAVVLGVLVAALAIPAGVLLARGGGEADFRGSEPPGRQMLPAFELRDDQGRLVRSADLGGKALAVTFLDTECTEACPIIAAQMAQAIEALGTDRSGVEALAITVDPVGDTPQRIEGFLARYRATGALRYLDGTVADLRPVWRGFKVASSLDSGNSNMHSAPVRIYDGRGRWRSTLHAGVDLTPGSLAHDLREALRAS